MAGRRLRFRPAMPSYDSAGLHLHYRRRRARGPHTHTALFIHGWTGSGRNWLTTMNALPPGYSAYAPDLRGVGRSARPEDGYTIEQYAADVFALIESLDLRSIDLIGHSMGGAIALLLALDHPARLRSLTLVCPVPADGLPAGGPDSQERRRAARTDRAVALTMAGAFYTRPVPPAVIEEGADAIMDASEGHYWRSLDAIESLRLGQRLPQLAVPTLLMAGDSDAVVPIDLALAMWEAIHGCELRVFADTGHAPALEAPEEYLPALLTFLDAAAPPGDLQ
ncbi:MAG: alpha/beta hydrolase [Dehalococcoidia bacterium]|nr:alpha/beta hydrolase [Dehalococcoidia bacterium]